jgi:hypothetical protein
MRRFTFLLATLLLLALAACSRTRVVSGPVAVRAPAKTPSAAPDEAGLVAILAKADAADGSVDTTVSKCAGCKLNMEGHPEHVVTAHGYTLQFCSDECKERSAPTIDTVIAALK